MESLQYGVFESGGANLGQGWNLIMRSGCSWSRRWRGPGRGFVFFRIHGLSKESLEPQIDGHGSLSRPLTRIGKRDSGEETGKGIDPVGYVDS